MAGSTVARILASYRSRSHASASRSMVLVAVAVGLLFGALACATDLAGDGDHTAHRATMPQIDAVPSDHSGHSDHSSASSQSGHESDLSNGDPVAGDHAGTACVAPVDLRPLGASVALVADPHQSTPMVMRAGCQPDVEPPVPRFS